MAKKVKLESDALQVCMVHALSTEKEEVMGLLIGEILDDGIPHIYAVIMLRRLDKRKDRVEISPEQLSNASTQAELGLETRVKRPMRIIGWYHSHPHITVWPSHVDVGTQSMYQMMDRDFVGLIISCYNDDAANLGQMQVTCFQSIDLPSSGLQRVEIPLEVIPCTAMSDACLDALYSLPEILFQEETDAYTVSLSHTEQDLITAVQNGAVFTKALMRIIEVICSPLLEGMENRLDERKEYLKSLELTRNGLLQEIQEKSRL